MEGDLKEAMLAREAESELSGDGVPFRARTGAGVVEWGMGGPLHRTSAPSTLDLRGGMGLYGGMLQLHGAVVTGTAEGGANVDRVQ